MRIERSYMTPPILSLAFLFILLSSFVLIQTIQTETLQTNWKMEFVGVGEIFETGQTTDFHFFLEDEEGIAIEGASMNATFDRLETVHQIDKKVYSVQNGLYETDVVFSVPGMWIVMIEAKKGNQYYRNQFVFNVEGPIIAKENRDPDDHFNLDQPLPIELQRELDNIPVFKR